MASWRFIAQELWPLTASGVFTMMPTTISASRVISTGKLNRRRYKSTKQTLSWAYHPITTILWSCRPLSPVHGCQDSTSRSCTTTSSLFRWLSLLLELNSSSIGGKTSMQFALTSLLSSLQSIITWFQPSRSRSVIRSWLSVWTAGMPGPIKMSFWLEHAPWVVLKTSLFTSSSHLKTNIPGTSLVMTPIWTTIASQEPLHSIRGYWSTLTIHGRLLLLHSPIWETPSEPDILQTTTHT